MQTLSLTCHNCSEPLPSRTPSPDYPEGWVCTTCEGLMYPEVNAATLSQEYGQDYFNGSEYLGYEQSKPVARKNFRRKIRILERQLGRSLQGERILELGCATGEFLKLCREAGASSLLGVEISDYCRKLCASDHLRVLSPSDPDLLRAISEFQPTLIVAWDVWEHLYDPASFFQRVMAAAPSVRTIALTTVRIDSFNARARKAKWRLFHPPTHISYPTEKSFRIFFEKFNFRLGYQCSFGYSRPLMEYLVALLPFLRKRLTAFAVFYKIPLYLNLFDIQMVIAMRADNKIR